MPRQQLQGLHRLEYHKEMHTQVSRKREYRRRVFHRMEYRKMGFHMMEYHRTGLDNYMKVWYSLATGKHIHYLHRPTYTNRQNRSSNGP